MIFEFVLNILVGVFFFFLGILYEKYWNPIRFEFKRGTPSNWVIRKQSGSVARNLQIHDLSWKQVPLTTVQGKAGVENYDLQQGDSVMAFQGLVAGQIYRMHWIERNRRKFFDFMVNDNDSVFHVKRRDARKLTQAEPIEKLRGKFAVG